MKLDGAFGDVEGGGDRLVTFTAGDQRQDFLFAVGEFVALNPIGELHCNVGGEVFFACVDLAHGGEQIFGGGVFEQVATGSGLQSPVDVFVGVVGGEDDDAGVGVEAANLLDGGHAFEDGHSQIHQGDLGLVLLVKGDRFLAVGGFGNDGHIAGTIDDRDDAVPHDRVIFGN